MELLLILLVVGIWIKAIFLIGIFFKGASEKEETIAILRPLDMEKSKLEIVIMKELVKCIEEDNEFAKAILKEDIDNSIEEFWDCMQTKINCLSIIGIPTELIYEGLENHKGKMNNRGYIFKN